MEVGKRVKVKACDHSELVGLTGEITGIDGQWVEVSLDGDGYETPFYAHELELEQVAA
jgi:hypothetical protein